MYSLVMLLLISQENDMARLTDLSFDLAGCTYRLLLDFDDAAIVNDTIGFDILAERSGGKFPGQTVNARVEIVPSQDTLIIYVGGKEVFRTDVFDHGDTPAEDFIQALPASLFGGDPILGCAVKAGLSSVVGQAIDCCRSLEAETRWRIVAEYLRCMSQHFGKISKIAMFRAFRCIAAS
jgi:hypothetical protein